MVDNTNKGMILLGVVDSGFDNDIRKQFKENLKDYKVDFISLSSYYKNIPKDKAERSKQEIKEYNFLIPDNIDFIKLKNDLLDIKQGKQISIPIYDSQNQIFKEDEEEIKDSQIIVLEGLLCFYNIRICRLIDIKLFIDTGNDRRLEKIILKRAKNGEKLEDIIEYFNTKIKLNYNNYIYPTRQNVDFFLRDRDYHQALAIILEYLKNILEKKNLFSYNKNVIDPESQFYESLFVVKDKNNTQQFNDEMNFLEDVFQDFESNSLEEEFVGEIRKTLIKMTKKLLNYHLIVKNPDIYSFDKIIYESDDINKINCKDLKNILFFKTAVLTEDDLKIPSYIRSQNKQCNIIICSIFLSRKAIILFSEQKFISLSLLVTLYFSDIFILYKDKIENDKTVFNKEELKILFQEVIQEKNINNNTSYILKE